MSRNLRESWDIVTGRKKPFDSMRAIPAAVNLFLVAALALVILGALLATVLATPAQAYYRTGYECWRQHPQNWWPRCSPARWRNR